MLCAAHFVFAQTIPDDPDFRTGRLDNGLSYYLCHNEKPEGCAEFYIAHNVGALQEEDNQDGLAYLAGKDIDFVNKSAMNGTIKAHISGGVPNLMIHIPAFNEDSLGRLFYFFEFACGVSGYTLGVNPFNQPGVEEYKKNMFVLLGKPGY